jgi:hypothetical protein
MGTKKLTPDEIRAWQALARAAKRLRAAQKQAARQRRREVARG